MGWTYTDKPFNVCEYFRDNFTWDNEKSSARCLKASMVKRRVVYAAVERVTKETGEKQVFAAVCLLHFTRSKDGYNFGYKDITEFYGPSESDCPKVILDMLSPLPEPPNNDCGIAWAKKWRERCYANLKARKELKFAIGTKIVYTNPIAFSDGSKPTVLICRRAKPLRFTDETGYGTYRISRRSLINDIQSGNLKLIQPPKQDKQRRYTVADAKFSSPTTIVTRPSFPILAKNGLSTSEIFNRHFAGDWGIVDRKIVNKITMLLKVRQEFILYMRCLLLRKRFG